MNEDTGQPQEECSQLTSYRNCTQRIRTEWGHFKCKREERLAQERRYGEASEKVAENILEDLFTSVLDWPLGNFNHQIQYADIVLTDLGIKKLIVEAKRPGALRWNRGAVDRALEQAERYAREQKVQVIAVSDGQMLYAANLVDGGREDRVYVALDAGEPPLDLWWLSMQGIWREAPYKSMSLLPPEPKIPVGDGLTTTGTGNGSLLHPKYHLPARCFAYVRDPEKTSTWKLPYLLADGAIDTKRLPKAVQCILSNYRGAKVQGIPETAIPVVLKKLAEAAECAGHLPPRSQSPMDVYRLLQDALNQLQRQR
ncbi:MAG: type I restriction enzyme HsdR N-terminal domain-containing protein [Acidobacteria bacterium]|nr:type I restriction enzyme HsdR N-terminal domain-containing protein [Acidobacteriota bacterium]